jgi:hypothetical protein
VTRVIQIVSGLIIAIYAVEGAVFAISKKWLIAMWDFEARLLSVPAAWFLLVKVVILLVAAYVWGMAVLRLKPNTSSDEGR